LRSNQRPIEAQSGVGWNASNARLEIKRAWVRMDRLAMRSVRHRFPFPQTAAKGKRTDRFPDKEKQYF
jgi:hypothetical protein